MVAERRPRTGTDDVVRITTAASDPRQDLRTRQRRYLISMGLRTVCFVGAVLAGNNPLGWGLILGAVFLPYVAVILANVASRSEDDFTLGPIDPQLRQITTGDRRH